MWNKKDQELIKNRTIKFANVVSNKLKIGVKGTYTGMEILKPYLGLWYEHEFDGEVKAAIQDGKDKLGGISSQVPKARQ
ncbi:hypothetical protein AGMMS49921_06420 [Endomicrobiia bacterium]|nr:hypothetical protein AGMMS49921_06420 [Endomicrobiia bacterium]